MVQPRLLARLEITNGTGTFDSITPTPDSDARASPHIKWTFTKTLDQTPNGGEVRIANLAQSTIDSIRETVRKTIEFTPEQRAELFAAGTNADPIEQVYDNAGIASVRLSWGFAGGSSSQRRPPLAVGFIAGSTTMTLKAEEDGTEWLVIPCEDGAQILGAGQLDKSYKAGTDTVTILRDLINAIGLSVEEPRLRTAMETALLARGIQVGELKNIGPYNARGVPASQLITTIMSALQLRWSIQDGRFLLLDSAEVLAGVPPLVLSADAGTLFGEPEPLEGGAYRVRTWPDTEARCGRQVHLIADGVNAQFKLDRSVSTGDTLAGGESVLTLDAVQVIQGVF